MRALWAPEAAVEFGMPASCELAAPAVDAPAVTPFPASSSVGSDMSASAASDSSAAALPASSADSAAGAAEAAKAEILDKRRRHVGPNLALFFQDEPLHIVEGRGAELFDAQVRTHTTC